MPTTSARGTLRRRPSPNRIRATTGWCSASTARTRSAPAARTGPVEGVRGQSKGPVEGEASRRGQDLWIVIDAEAGSAGVRAMARKLRLEGEGGVYHVLNRGNYRAHLFRAREDQGSLPEVPGRGLREDGVGGARVVCDVESLPRCAGDAERKLGRWDALAARHVCDAIQPPAPGERPSIPGALQEPLRRPRGRIGRVVPLHPPQSGARRGVFGGRVGALALVEPVLAVRKATTAQVVRSDSGALRGRILARHGGRPQPVSALFGLAGRGCPGAKGAEIRPDVARLGDWLNGIQAGSAAGTPSGPRVTKRS